MTYVNKYTDEKYEDRNDCRDNLITMQESGKSEVIDIMEWVVYRKGQGDAEYEELLRAGMDFIKNCIRFSEAHLEFRRELDETFIDPYIKEVD